MSLLCETEHVKGVHHQVKSKDQIHLCLRFVFGFNVVEQLRSELVPALTSLPYPPLAKLHKRVSQKT